MSPRTRVVLAQNTFGLSADLDALDRRRAPDTERSSSTTAPMGSAGAIGAGPTARRRPRPSTRRSGASPSPPGWEGSRSRRMPGSPRGLAALERSAAEPRALDSALLGAMLFARERIATPRTLRSGRSVYRAVSRAGLVPGSSGRRRARRDGHAGRVPHADVGLPGAPGHPPAGHAGREDPQAASSGAALLGLAGRAPSHAGVRADAAEHAFLRYPLRVLERDAFVADADRRGVLLGDWFRLAALSDRRRSREVGLSPRRAPGGRTGGVRDRQPPDRRGARRPRAPRRSRTLLEASVARIL